MKNITFLPILFILLFLLSCQSNNQVQLSPLDNFSQIDEMLTNLAEKPQTFSVSTSKASNITGKAGTIIHLNPVNLETLDGSPLGTQIEIELLEMIDKTDMMLNNAPTVSNGQLLVTGGAYYINMRSNGQQLRIKEGKGLEVEFPKLSDGKMSLFLGERDSLGQINWVATKEKFAAKNIPDAVPPKKAGRKVQKKYVKKSGEIGAILDFIEGDTTAKSGDKEEILTEAEYQEYLKKQKEIAYRRKTYEAISLLNFGWINCDRFMNDPGPKTDIQMIVKDEVITEARFYAIFENIQSVVQTSFIRGLEENPFASGIIYNIPEGKKVKIIGLTAKADVPYLFESTINTTSDKQVAVSFVASTQTKIRKRMKGL